jgi:hypothetical protein
MAEQDVGEKEQEDGVHVEYMRSIRSAEDIGTNSIRRDRKM